MFSSYATTTNHFLTGSWHEIKSGFYMMTGNDQFSSWMRRKLQSTSQSQTCSKTRSWSLVVCYTSNPVQLSESWWNHYIWEIYSANRWNAPKTIPVTSTGQKKGPNFFPHGLTTCHTTKASKVEWIGLQSFAPFTIFTWPPTNRLPLLQVSQKHFAEKRLPQPAGGRKCFLRVCQILKYRSLC